jgi:DNA-binding response OmpR family regulator
MVTSSSPYKILVIDDDPGLLTLLKMGLECDEFEIITARFGEEGLRCAYEFHPEAVILDVMMPKVDGWTVCQRLRQLCDSPIIMLSARSDTNDIVRGLSIGADDYIVKPCRLEELRARLRKLLLKPASARREAAFLYDDGCLRIEAEHGRVSRDGQMIDLTPTELRLLLCLVRQRGSIVPHRELLSHVWGPQFTDDVQYLSVYIRYLRQKIEAAPSHPRYILTKHRVGYYFADHGASP